MMLVRVRCPLIVYGNPHNNYDVQKLHHRAHKLRYSRIKRFCTRKVHNIMYVYVYVYNCMCTCRAHVGVRVDAYVRACMCVTQIVNYV